MTSQRCPSCQGAGIRDAAGFRKSKVVFFEMTCRHCEGTGRVSAPCPTCLGHGEIEEADIDGEYVGRITCPDCHGDTLPPDVA